MNSFVHGGTGAYQAALRADYVSQRKELERRLREAATEQEHSRVADELRDLKTNFRTRSAHGGCLF
jgi:tRNA A37 N6-isopentenylltransferase MiaA